MAIKGLGKKTQEAAAHGPPAAAVCRTLMILCTRVRPEEDEVRALIAAGAFKALHPGVESAHLLWRLAQGRRARAVEAQGAFHPKARRRAAHPARR